MCRQVLAHGKETRMASHRQTYLSVTTATCLVRRYRTSGIIFSYCHRGNISRYSNGQSHLISAPEKQHVGRSVCAESALSLSFDNLHKSIVAVAVQIYMGKEIIKPARWLIYIVDITTN